MSRIFKTLLTFLFMLLIANVSGQYKIGLQGGVGISDYVGVDFSNDSEEKLGIVAGFFYERELNLTMSIAFEFNYEQKGTFYRFFPLKTTEVVVDSRANYLTVPLLMRAYFGRNAEFYINGGLSASRLFNQTTKHSANEYGYKILSDPFFNYKLNNWDASILAGFGFNVYDIVLDIRYHHGIVNIYEGKNAPIIRNHFISATLGYTLYKRKVQRCFNSR